LQLEKSQLQLDLQQEKFTTATTLRVEKVLVAIALATREAFGCNHTYN
jgi:hypothetical protein